MQPSLPSSLITQDLSQGKSVLPWRTERLLFDATTYYAEIFRELEATRATAEVEAYIFADDECGHQILEALKATAARGVKVRLLVDGAGSATSFDSVEKGLAGSAVAYKVFHPLWRVGPLRWLRTFNRRNHRKTWIFDGERAIVTSANIAANDWRDMGLSVAGAPVQRIREAFDLAWARSSGWRLRAPRYARSGESPLVRLNDSLRSRHRQNRSFLEKIRGARQSIWLANAYFAPPLRLIREMARAVRRGVDVRLLVPRHSDIFFMPWLTSTYYAELIESGVKVFEYEPHFYHAKICLIDDWMTVGSTNLNHRSLLHDLELDLVVTHAENQRELRASLERDFAHSPAIGPETLKQKSIVAKLLSRVLRLFRYWL